MPLKGYRPLTPTQRFKSLPAFDEVTKSKPHRNLIEPRKKTGGRNNYGRLTSRHIGGGHKQHYRKVDFKRAKRGVSAEVIGIEYDPNRSARIALIKYADGEFSYILAPNGLRVGSTVAAGDDVASDIGNALPLRNIPVGTTVHCVEMLPGKGAQIARAAGSGVQVLAREGEYAQIRMRSGEIRRVHVNCRATIGEVGNEEHNLRSIGKAGANRWRGIRPTVRGETMNPVDHPLGGRTRGNRHPVSPWGTPTKGYHTRKNKRTDGMIVRRRHAVKG